MKRLIRFFVISLSTLVIAQYSPAPIVEEESPTPAPMKSATPQLRPSPKPTPRSALTTPRSHSGTSTAAISHLTSPNRAPTPTKLSPKKTAGGAFSQQGGRLVVQRAANFGLDLAVRLEIDGAPVANILQGQRYDAPLAAGRHRLTVSTATGLIPPTSIETNIRPRRTEAFTAVWDSDRVVLRPSTSAAE